MTTQTRFILEQPRVSRSSASAFSQRSLGRRALAPLALTGLWWLATARGWVDASILPGPGVVLASFADLWTHGDFGGHLAASLGRALAGGAVGIAFGLFLGLLAGLSSLADELYDALLQMLRTIPFLALVPLFIVWFGIGEFPKLLLIALATCFPMYINVNAGVRNVDRKVVEAMRSFGLNGTRLVFQVVIPLAMPSILTGLRYALGISVLVLVAAEQINASEGLGYLLHTAQAYQQVDVILICILVYSLLGLVADLSVRLLEKSLMPWRQGVANR